MSDFVMPTTGKDLKKIQDAIKEASNAQLQIEQHRDHIGDIKADLKEELGLPPKMFGKLLRAYHKQTYGKEVQEAEEFQDLYEGVFGSQDED